MASVYNYSTDPSTSSLSSADYVKNSGATNWHYSFENIAIPVKTTARTMYFSVDIAVWSGQSYANDIFVADVHFLRADGTEINWGHYTTSNLNSRWGLSLSVPANTATVRVTFYPDLPLSSAKTANYTLTMQARRYRLADQNSYAYIDGSTAGYVYAPDGTTVIANVDLSSTGTMTIDGTLSMSVQPFVALDATVSIGGSIEIYRTGTEAHGGLSIGGSLALWPYGPVSATAGVAITGSLQMAAIVPISATAGMTLGGSLEAFLTWPSESIADLTISGSLDIGLPPDMTATAALTITGSLEVAIATQMVARGDVTITGSLNAAQAVPDASFADFAIFGVTAGDPMRSVVSASNGGINSGATGADWTRVYAQFTAPVDNPQWRRAAYAVPGIQFASVPAGGWQEFTSVQVEVADAATPGAFAPAASLRPLVYPDRLNLSPHSVGVIADPGPWYFADPITSPITADTTGAHRVVLRFGQNLLIGTSLDWLRPGASYTASLYLKVAGKVADVSISAALPSFATISQTVRWADATDDAALGVGWRRLSVTFVAPGDGSAKLFFSPRVVGQNSDEHFDVAGLLVEEGIELRPYFWPDGVNPDIGYRAGYSDATGGIFYYKDKLRRTYILKQALQDQVPAGIGIGDPEFWTIPHVDV